MRSIVVFVALTLAVAMAQAQPTPLPESAAAKAHRRADLPRCDDRGVTAEQIREAFRKHVERSGDTNAGFTDAFDEIGDELGCRWPRPGEQGERSQGVPFYERSYGTEGGLR